MMRTLSIFVLLLVLAGAVQAQDGLAGVRVDGRVLFRVAATDTTDEQTRARRVERRISRLLERPDLITAAQVLPGATEAERTLVVSGVPVVTVTPADAEELLSTVDVLASQWAVALDTGLARATARRQSGWQRFAAEVEGSVASAFGRLLDSAIVIVPRALAALLVLGFFWIFAIAIRRLMRWTFRRVVDDLTVENLVKQMASVVIWLIGLLVALGALGLDPQTAVAGLGLTGLALGFALKDVLSNLVAGLLMLVLRPFRIGDQIAVEDTEGGVERITLRATEIRTYDGRLVLVPNGQVFTSRVTNNTASPVRRGDVTVFLGYDEDLQRASAVLLEAAGIAQGVLDEPAPSLRVQELGPSDIELTLLFWTDSRRSDYVATASNVRNAAIEALRAASIGLPAPDRRVLVPGETAAWRKALQDGG